MSPIPIIFTHDHQLLSMDNINKYICIYIYIYIDIYYTYIYYFKIYSQDLINQLSLYKGHHKMNLNRHVKTTTALSLWCQNSTLYICYTNLVVNTSLLVLTA